MSMSETVATIDWTTETELEKRISYTFDDRPLFVRALSHRSYANERGPDVDDNEVVLIGADGETRVDKRSKDECAGAILDNVIPLLTSA